MGAVGPLPARHVERSSEGGGHNPLPAGHAGQPPSLKSFESKPLSHAAVMSLAAIPPVGLMDMLEPWPSTVSK